jgi:hypothetical protein
VNTRKDLELAKEAMVRQMAEAEQSLQKYAKFPEDDYDDLTVLRFSKKAQVTVKKPLTLDEVREFIRNSPKGPGTYRMPSGNSVILNTGDMLQVSGTWQSDEGAVREPNYTVEESTETRWFHYAALKTGGKWYLTGRETKPFTWDELVEFMVGKVELYLVMDDGQEIVELA